MIEIGSVVNVNYNGVKFSGEVLGKFTYEHDGDIEYIVETNDSSMGWGINDITLNREEAERYGVDMDLHINKYALYIDDDNIEEEE